MILWTVILFTFQHLGAPSNALAKPGDLTWKSLGYRWGLESRSDGTLKRVVDLSYPDLLNPRSLGQILPSLDLSALKQLLLGISVNPSNREVLTEALTVLNQARLRGRFQIVFPREGWTQVPWKGTSHLRSPQAPQSFRLNEIDWAMGSRSPAQVETQIALINERFGRIGNLGLKFLDSFKFERRPDGSYEIFYDPQSVRSLGPGKTIVDFDSAMGGFWESAETELLFNAIGQLMGLIPVPILSALLSTVSSRFFHSLDLLDSFHQEMGIEMLAQANSTDDYSPWSALDKNAREVSAKYILWSETSILGALRWIFKSPWTQFNEDRAFEIKTAQENLKWFSSTSTHAPSPMTFLNARFISAESHSNSGIFLLSSVKYNLLGVITSPHGDGPPLALDLLHPERLSVQREWFDLLATTLSFASHFIPNGGLLYSAFKLLLEANVDRLKIWEARLLGHLKERELLGENWNSEIHTLESQQVNRLELFDKEAHILIETRKRALGIR